MISIIDYDAGNIRSVQKALAFLGAEAKVTRDPEEIQNASALILPGVGSFGASMKNLERFGLVPLIREAVDRGKPFLGICLGLQLLFEGSEEDEGVSGLSLLPGKIRRIPEGEGRKIPHMGWNSLTYPTPGRLFEKIPEGAYVYFVHSYYLPVEGEPPYEVTARTEYGAGIGASVEKGNLFACQFHPEKSGEVGLQILRNFYKLV